MTIVSTKEIHHGAPGAAKLQPEGIELCDIVKHIAEPVKQSVHCRPGIKKFSGHGPAMVLP